MKSHTLFSFSASKSASVVDLTEDSVVVSKRPSVPLGVEVLDLTEDAPQSVSRTAVPSLFVEPSKLLSGPMPTGPPHCRTVEFRAILSALQTLTNTTTKTTTKKKSDAPSSSSLSPLQFTLHWERESPTLFRRPRLSVRSKRHADVEFVFELRFPAVAGSPWPRSPPKVIPQVALPAALYFFSQHCPLLSASRCSTNDELLFAVRAMLSLWDAHAFPEENNTSSSSSSSSSSRSLSTQTLLGGSLSDLPATPTEIDAFLAKSAEECAIEVLLSLWLDVYPDNDCDYDFGDFEATLEEEILADGQVIVAGATTGSNKRARESPAKTAAAAKKKKIAAGAGTGYSTARNSHSSVAVQIERPLRSKVLEKVAAKLTFMSRRIMIIPVAVARATAAWMLRSPLLALLHFEMSQLSSGDALRAQDEILRYFTVATFLDRLISRARITPSEAQQKQLQSIFAQAQALWIDTEIIEEDSLEGNTDERRAIAEFKNRLNRLKQGEKAKEKEGPAARAPEESGVAASSSSSSSAAAPARALSAVKEKVHFIEGLEKNHTFRRELHASGGSTATNACPKFFLRELKTLNQSLSDDVLVFVSEQHPNLLTVVMFVPNDECPYYGGAYLFDVFIPATYPQVSPKVQFLTTGYGSVRFNPNLYNCGKVCLSLLGTWAGEPWNPKVSNLTQVLNSILFLIFTKDPYYNEPGYTRSSSNDMQSLRYDAAALSNSIKFAMKDHLENNTSVGPISEAIRSFYVEKWASLRPGVNAIVDKLHAKGALADYATVQANLRAIDDWVAKASTSSSKRLRK